MADSNVIKEFLVLIGYKSDEAALVKLKNGIAAATKTIVELGTVITATALAVEAGVAKFAENLEDLYFATVRTGSSASSLRAFDRAAQDFGASAGSATQAAESMARWMRNNPAAGGIMQGWWAQAGESAYDAQGHLKGASDQLLALGHLMQQNTAQGKGFQNEPLANVFGGMDQNLMLAIQDPRFRSEYKKFQDELAGNGFNKATANSHVFMMSLRRLENQLFIFGTTVVDVLQKKLGVTLDDITAWFQTNGPRLAADIANFAKQFIDDFDDMVKWFKTHWHEINQEWQQTKVVIQQVIDVLKPSIEWLWKEFVALNDATGGWSTTLLILIPLLSKLGAFSILSGVGSLAAGIFKLATAFSGLETGALILAGISASLATIAGLFVAGDILWLWDKLAPQGWKPEDASSAIGGFFASKDEDDMQARRRALVNAGIKLGLPASVAVEMANVGEAEDATLNPAAVNPISGARGIFQWLGFHPGERGARVEDYLKRMFNTDILHATAEQQMYAAVWEMKGGSGDLGATQAYRMMMANQGADILSQKRGREIFASQFERPGDGLGGDLFRAGAAAQHTNIYVYGNVDSKVYEDILAQKSQRTRQLLPSMERPQ